MFESLQRSSRFALIRAAFIRQLSRIRVGASRTMDDISVMRPEEDRTVPVWAKTDATLWGLRVGATSGNFVGVGAAAAGVVVGFLMYLGFIPAQVAIGLMITSAIVMILAFLGAGVAHYKKSHDATVGDLTAADEIIPDFFTADARVCWVIERDGGYAEWDTTLTPESFNTAVRAVVVSFRNDSPKPIPAVRAEIHYVKSGRETEPARIACGTWLGEPIDRAYFGASETKELLIALYDDAAMFIVNDNRRKLGIVSGCTRRQLPFSPSFGAWIMLSALDANDRLIGQAEERVSVGINREGPTVRIIGPPGAIRGDEPHTMQTLK